VDVSALNPGELVVLYMNRTFVGVLRRTEEQQAAAAATVGALSDETDADRVTNPEYLVAELKCLHRGCYVAYTGEADSAFVCPCHRTSFDAAGRVISGKTSKSLPFIPHAIEGSVVNFAV
jgi:Rieske Fe-S protein